MRAVLPTEEKHKAVLTPEHVTSATRNNDVVSINTKVKLYANNEYE